MKRAVAILILSACGDVQTPPPPGVDAGTAGPRYAAIYAVPDRVSLLGPGAGRAIEVLARGDDGLLIAVDQYEATSTDASIARVANKRLLGVTPGSARIDLEIGGASATIQVMVGDQAPFAAQILAFDRGINAGFGQDRMPQIVLGPPTGGGEFNGSLDVLSLGMNGSIEIGFGGAQIYDGPGADLIVFENAFRVGAETFSEPAAVEIFSNNWIALPCDRARWPYAGCAGVKPVFAGPAAPDVDATDATHAGGDPIDLATEANWIDRLRLTDLGLGQNIGTNAGFDLDAIALIHVLPEIPASIRVLPSSVQLRIGDTVPLPSAHAIFGDGRDLAGIEADIHNNSSVVLVEGAMIRAVRTGTAVLSYFIGDQSADLSIEVLP